MRIKETMIQKLKNWLLKLMQHSALAPLPEQVKLSLITTKYGYALRKSGSARSIKLFTDYNEAYRYSKAYALKHNLNLHLSGTPNV